MTQFPAKKIHGVTTVDRIGPPGLTGRATFGLLLLLGALLGVASAQAATKYVVPGGAGIKDGSSWANAASSIRAAVDTSPSGTEVWVAGGTYTGVSDPVVSVKAGVAVVGGFAGTETSRSQRDWAAHPTTIDGESARQCADVNTSATLDGFTVTRGYAASGGGVYSRGTVANCTVTGNMAFGYGGNSYGGGIYSNEGAVLNCTVMGNSARGWGGSDYGGGGIYNDNGTVANCAVTGNLAMNGNDASEADVSSYGGGIYNGNGTVTNCRVTSNSTNSSSGGVFCPGGGIYNMGGSVRNCTVAGNSASNSGGDGGGIYSVQGTVMTCIITQNSALNGNGGGICSASGTVIGCMATGNSAGRGGGIRIQGNGTVMNCAITGNSAVFGGGISNGNGTVTNCTVTWNMASAANASGGGIWNTGTVTNCTITGNSGTNGGGVDNSNGMVTNSIVWLNGSADITGGSVSFSCYGEAVSGVLGNLSADPLFVSRSNSDPATWNLHLRSTSPCKDRGTLDGAPATDIEGRPRPGEDGKVSMGAYEYGTGPVPSKSQCSVRSTHSEAWSAKSSSVVSKDTYSVSAKMQLSDSFDLATVNEQTTLSVQAGGVLFQNTLGNAAKKKLDNPTMGGSATFTRTETDAQGKTRATQTVSVRWDKKKSLTITMTGKPLAGMGGVSENILDLSGATIAAGVVTYDLGVSVAFGGESSGDTILTCSGKKKTKSAPGAAGTQLTGWSVSGKE